MIGPGHIASTAGYAYKLLFLIFVTLSYIMLQCDIAVGGALSTSVRPSVCLSVCLSHASTDSKLTTAASCGFYHWAEGL